MNRVIPRAEIEKFTAALAEKRRRLAKAEHSTRGYRDEDGIWRGGLLSFVRYFWHVLEPGTPFIPGMPIEAVIEHLEAVTFGEITNLLVNVPPGCCKALDHDTPILTTWGWEKHGDLVPGDFVFGPDGKPKRVLGCTPDRIEAAYAVKFDDGAEIVASGGHLWEIERDVASVKPHYRRGRKRMVVPTSDLRISGYKHTSTYEKRPDRIELAEAIEMPPKNLMIDPYVLGAWLGDGGSNSGIIYAAEQDAEHFCKLGRVACVNPAVPPRKQAFYHILVDGLAVRLRLMGLQNNKHIPDDYLNSSIEQRWELLRGLMDTDGMCAKNGSCSFTNKNVAIANGFMSLCLSLGLKAWKTETWSKIDGVVFGPYQYINFVPPVGTTVFKLTRKQARVRGNMNDRSRNRYVDAVTPIGPRRVKCIHVEGNLYLAGKELITTHNSLLTNVFWPAFEWGPMELSHVRYVTFSYSSSNTERDNQRFGDLIACPDYQAMYPHVKIRQKGFEMVSNLNHGWKLASSVSGSVTGKRGNRAICDDLNNVSEAESKTVLESTNRWFRESLSSRLNNMETDAKIVIAQRVGEGDVSGEILSTGLPYSHLCIPMEMVWQADEDGQPYTTSIGWVDPRWRPTSEECEGELAWPERFSEKAVQALKIELGPYASAAQLQQTPEARGGGVLKREWWLSGEQYMTDNKFPPFSYLVASLDGAFDSKEENDASALTIWGIFTNEHGYPRAMLVHAWAKRLQISGIKVELEPGEHESVYRRRAMPHWGLVEWVADTCNRFKVDRLLIENKASGKPAAQSLQNSNGRQGWAIVLVEPKGDKYARGLAVQPSFSQGMIYAPDREWAQDVIDECVVGGTLIITSDGVKSVESLHVGDQVLTHLGRFRPILAISTRFADELVRLEPKSLDPITLTANHPVYAFDLTVDRTVKSGAEWISAGSVKPRNYRENIRDGIPVMEAIPSECHAMILPIIRPENAISEIDLRDWATLPNGKRYDFVEDGDSFTTSHHASQWMRWQQPLDYQFGRVLGLYLAEGSGRRARTCWSFHAEETKFIKEIQTFISDRLGCASQLHTQGRGTTVIASLPLIESFFEECGRGSHNKRVPSWVWDAPDDFIEGVLSGYMDGDGSHNANLWVATTVSPSLAWGIRLLALRVGIHATINLHRAAGEGSINGRSFKTLTAYAVSWRHDRKNSGSAIVSDDLAAYSVMKTSVVDGGSFVFNMEVAEDSSYCTTSGVVHNCAIFPRGRHDDRYDSTTQAIKHLRDSGLLRSDEDRRAEELDAVRHKGAPREAPYPGFRRLARR